MKKIFLLLCCFCFIDALSAQQLVQERLYKLGNTASGFGSSALTREGNVVLTGSTTANPGYNSMLALINPSGDTIWMRNGPLISTGGIGIKQVSRSGYVFHTTKRYTSPAASGTIMQKYDGNGLLKWSMPYATNSFDRNHLLLSATDSGYYLGGRNIVAGKNSNFALSRTDSLGNLKWRKGYDWSNSDFFSEMQHTLNGNLIMYGISSAPLGPQRLKLLVVNQNGDSVLGRLITIVGDPNRNERLRAVFCDVRPLSDGGFLMAAEIDTSVANAAPELGMVVKADANLQPIWHYINHSVPNNVTFTRARELTDGSVVLLAYERKGALSTPGNKFFLYRFSAAGSLLNIYTFTSNIAAQIQAVTLEALPDSSFIIGGGGVVTPAPNYSSGYYVAKVKIAGLPPARPLPTPMVTTGIKPGIVATKFFLGQSYPNPVSESVTIPYSLPVKHKKAKIQIRDITGREVGNYNIKQNSNSLEVSLSNLSNGLYTYTLLVDEKPIATKKLAVLK